MPPALYFIALLPPPAIRARVRALKRAMSRDYAAKHALKSPAHITLRMPFRHAPADEASLHAALQAFAARETPFTVELDGFDCFAPRVLFIRVRTHASIRGLHERLLQRMAEDLALDTRPAHRPMHPHLTIATRDLSAEAFEAAWPVYQSRPFAASFRARHLTLLKHNGSHWDVHRTFWLGRTES